MRIRGYVCAASRALLDGAPAVVRRRIRARISLLHRMDQMDGMAFELSGALGK